MVGDHRWVPTTTLPTQPDAPWGSPKGASLHHPFGNGGHRGPQQRGRPGQRLLLPGPGNERRLQTRVPGAGDVPAMGGGQQHGGRRGHLQVPAGPVLHSLGGADVAHRHGRSLMQPFARGEPISFAGDSSDSLFVLKTGPVEITLRSPAGQEVMLALLGPGDLFGEWALSGRGPRGEEAVVLDQTLVCQVEVSDSPALLAANHKFNREINKLVGQYLKKVSGCLSDLVFKSAGQRVRDLLRELAAAPGTRVASGLHRVVIRLRLSSQDLARQASASRPAATTLRRSLQ